MKGRPGRRSSRPYPIIRHCQHRYEEQSSLDFDAYLSVVERELPETPDDVRADIFFPKLHKDVRNQKKLSEITSLPTTYMKMVSLAQRMWEGLRQEG